MGNPELPWRRTLAGLACASDDFPVNGPHDAVVQAFSAAAREFQHVVEDGALRGVELLRELRGTLANLYAMGPRLPVEGPSSEPRPRFDLLPDDQRRTVEASLVKRLPRPMYWAALLPATYATVGDAGVRTFADELAGIYEYLEDGFRLQAAGGSGADVLDWWGDWETSWGGSAVRCLAILHEVIVDLDLHIYGADAT